MKIVLCSSDSVTGVAGPGSWERRLVAHLVARGYDVRTVCLCRSGRAEDGVNHQHFEKSGISSSSHLIRTMKEAVLWLLGQMEEFQPDVVIANNVTTVHYAAPYLAEAGIPVISVSHSDESFYNKLMATFYPESAGHRVGGAVLVSQHILERAKRLCGDLPVACIPCGAPVPDEQCDTPDKEFRLIYVGRISQRQKRIFDVAKAMAATCAAQSNVRALMLGDGQDIAAVRELLMDLEGGDRVEVLGRRPLPEVQKIMRTCHAFVLLSDYEGLPIALMEAMAVGLVPIVSRIESGVPELVIDKVNGFYADDRFKGVITSVESLLDDPIRFEKMSQAARQTIKEGFEETLCFRQWEDFMGDLVARQEKSIFQMPETVTFHDVSLLKPYMDHSMVPFPKSVAYFFMPYIWQLWKRVPWKLRMAGKALIGRKW